MTSPAATHLLELERLLPGEGDLAHRVRLLDWSHFPPGPPERWPENFRTMLSLCLAVPLPAALYWGPELILFYNDTFVPLLADGEHPVALGRSARESASWESWRAPVERALAAEGPPRQSGAVPAMTFSPVFGPGHRVDGVLALGGAGRGEAPAGTDALRGILQSITTNPDAAHALRRSEERLRRPGESDMLSIAFFDAGGTLTDANDAFLEMLGFTRDDLRYGRVRWSELAPTEWMPRTQEALDEFAATGRITPHEREYLNPDGRRFWGLCGGARLGVSGLGVAFILDITERKRADEALRRHREDLELRVQERTAELDAVNGTLRDEIMERERVERARHEALRQLVGAQEEERRRISRELHDEVGQHLAALMLGLKSLESGCDLRPPAETLRALQAITATVGQEIHALALELRPTALDDLGLLRALSHYVAQWSARTKIEIEFHSSGWSGARLPSHIETTVYRIVQEALTNVLKHARAHRVSLIVERRPDQAVVIVEDDGKGFDPEAAARSPIDKRLGLLGMKERAALVDGEVNIESSPGEGTTVFVRIPLGPTVELLS